MWVILRAVIAEQVPLTEGTAVSLSLFSVKPESLVCQKDLLLGDQNISPTPPLQAGLFGMLNTLHEEKGSEARFF